MKYFITLTLVVFFVEYSQSQVSVTTHLIAYSSFNKHSNNWRATGMQHLDRPAEINTWPPPSPLCQGSLGDPVVNITFGSGTNTFGPPLQTTATGYGYQNSSCIIDNNYEITNQVFGCYPGDWLNLPQDHTGNAGGYFMLIGASNTPSDFYLDTVRNLCANTTYEFAAWALNMMLPSGCSFTGGLRPNVTFNIEDLNGNILGSYNTGDIGTNASPTWVQYGFFFSTPASASSVVLRMTNNGPGGCGNDIALDDITFRACGPTTTASFNTITIVDSVSVCGGSNITLYGNTVNGYPNPAYLWQSSSDSGKTWTDIPNSNMLQINFVAPLTAISKNYKYRMLTGEGANINSTNCRVASNATILNIKPKSQGKLTGSSICSGDVANLQLMSAIGSSPFSISYSDGTNTFTQNNLGNNSTFPTPYTLTDTTTFILTSITDGGGCTNMNPTDSAITINVNPLPQGSITGASACQGQASQISFAITQGTPSYSFVVNDGTSNMNITNLQALGAFGVPATNVTKTYTLVSITDKDGCTRNSNFTTPTATINVLPSPNVSFAALPALCKNDSSFTITQAAENSGIQGSGFFYGNGVSSAGFFNISSVSPGSYPIEYKYTATNGCADSAIQPIVVNPVPIANAGPDVLGCAGISIQLNASGGTYYQWSPPNGLSNPAIADPLAMTNTAVSYIVAVTNAEGCTTYDSLNIIISPLGKNAYKVPNAFTPNGDGKNDCFGLQRWGGIDLKEFSIYNRWGQLIFSSKNSSACWDGTFNGVPQDSGGFIYIIRANTPCGNINLRGTVFLIR